MNRRRTIWTTLALGAVGLIGCLCAQSGTTEPRLIGDGRADDTAALQSRINAAEGAGRGGVLRVPAGTYRTKRLTTKGFLTLVGEGRGKSVLKLDGTGSLLANATPGKRIQEIVLRDLTLQGTGGTALDLDSVSNSLVENVHISGFEIGVRCHSPKPGFALYNRFRDVNVMMCGTAYIFSGTSTNENLLDAGRIAACKIGVSITDGNHNKLSKVAIEGNHLGVFVDATSNALADQSHIDGCRFEHNKVAIEIASKFVRRTQITSPYNSANTDFLKDGGLGTVLFLDSRGETVLSVGGAVMVPGRD